jgi:hypothetical protein
MKRSAVVVLPKVVLSIVILATAGVAAQRSKPKATPRSGGAPPAMPSDKVSGVNVQIDSASAGPRQVEDRTERAIVRDYGNAWATLARALEQNRTDGLPLSFVGDAQKQLAQRIQRQRQNGLHTRYVDRGHKVEAIFYSPEGSAMQLRDTANVEIQLLDGSKVVHSEQVTLNYLALMTVAEDRWKVRELEAVGNTQ